MARNRRSSPVYTVSYYGAARAEDIRRHFKKELFPAVQEGAEYIQSTVSIPAPPASEKGKPPHLRESRLHDSIRAVFKNSYNVEIVAGDGDAFYAGWMEFGKRFMAARPFMGPSIPVVKKIVKDRLRRKKVKWRAQVGIK